MAATKIKLTKCIHAINVSMVQGCFYFSMKISIQSFRTRKFPDLQYYNIIGSHVILKLWHNAWFKDVRDSPLPLQVWRCTLSPLRLVALASSGRMLPSFLCPLVCWRLRPLPSTLLYPSGRLRPSATWGLACWTRLIELHVHVWTTEMACTVDRWKLNGLFCCACWWLVA